MTEFLIKGSYIYKKKRAAFLTLFWISFIVSGILICVYLSFSPEERPDKILAFIIVLGILWLITFFLYLDKVALVRSASKYRLYEVLLDKPTMFDRGGVGFNISFINDKGKEIKTTIDIIEYYLKTTTRLEGLVNKRARVMYNTEDGDVYFYDILEDKKK